MYNEVKVQPPTSNPGNSGQQWGTGNSGTPLKTPATELPAPLQDSPLPTQPTSAPVLPVEAPASPVTITPTEEWIGRVQHLLASHPGNPRKRVDQLVKLKQQYQHEVLGLPYSPNWGGGQQE